MNHPSETILQIANKSNVDLTHYLLQSTVLKDSCVKFYNQHCYETFQSSNARTRISAYNGHI